MCCWKMLACNEFESDMRDCSNVGGMLGFMINKHKQTCMEGLKFAGRMGIYRKIIEIEAMLME